MDLSECFYEQSYDGCKSGLSGRIEIRVRPERRRQWSSAPSWPIFRETLAPGSTAQAVADWHEIGTNLIYTMRKQMLRATMASFAAVEIKPDVRVALPGSVEPPSCSSQSQHHPRHLRHRLSHHRASCPAALRSGCSRGYDCASGPVWTAPRCRAF